MPTDIDHILSSLPHLEPFKPRDETGGDIARLLGGLDLTRSVRREDAPRVLIEDDDFMLTDQFVKVGPIAIPLDRIAQPDSPLDKFVQQASTYAKVMPPLKPAADMEGLLANISISRAIKQRPEAKLSRISPSIERMLDEGDAYGRDILNRINELSTKRRTPGVVEEQSRLIKELERHLETQVQAASLSEGKTLTGRALETLSTVASILTPLSIASRLLWGSLNIAPSAYAYFFDQELYKKMLEEGRAWYGRGSPLISYDFWLNPDGGVELGKFLRNIGVIRGNSTASVIGELVADIVGDPVNWATFGLKGVAVKGGNLVVKTYSQTGKAITKVAKAFPELAAGEKIFSEGRGIIDAALKTIADGGDVPVVWSHLADELDAMSKSLSASKSEIDNLASHLAGQTAKNIRSGLDEFGKSGDTKQLLDSIEDVVARGKQFGASVDDILEKSAPRVWTGGSTAATLNKRAKVIGEINTARENLLALETIHDTLKGMLDGATGVIKETIEKRLPEIESQIEKSVKSLDKMELEFEEMLSKTWGQKAARRIARLSPKTSFGEAALKAVSGEGTLIGVGVPLMRPFAYALGDNWLSRLMVRGYVTADDWLGFVSQSPRAKRFAEKTLLMIEKNPPTAKNLIKKYAVYAGSGVGKAAATAGRKVQQWFSPQAGGAMHDVVISNSRKEFEMAHSAIMRERSILMGAVQRATKYGKVKDHHYRLAVVAAETSHMLNTALNNNEPLLTMIDNMPISQIDKKIVGELAVAIKAVSKDLFDEQNKLGILPEGLKDFVGQLYGEEISKMNKEFGSGHISGIYSHIKPGYLSHSASPIAKETAPVYPYLGYVPREVTPVVGEQMLFRGSLQGGADVGARSSQWIQHAFGTEQINEILKDPEIAKKYDEIVSRSSNATDKTDSLIKELTALIRSRHGSRFVDFYVPGKTDIDEFTIELPRRSEIDKLLNDVIDKTFVGGGEVQTDLFGNVTGEWAKKAEILSSHGTYSSMVGAAPIHVRSGLASEILAGKTTGDVNLDVLAAGGRVASVLDNTIRIVHSHKVDDITARRTIKQIVYDSALSRMIAESSANSQETLEGLRAFLYSTADFVPGAKDYLDRHADIINLARKPTESQLIQAIKNSKVEKLSLDSLRTFLTTGIEIPVADDVLSVAGNPKFHTTVFTQHGRFSTLERAKQLKKYIESVASGRDIKTLSDLQDAASTVRVKQSSLDNALTAIDRLSRFVFLAVVKKIDQDDLTGVMQKAIEAAKAGNKDAVRSAMNHAQNSMSFVARAASIEPPNIDVDAVVNGGEQAVRDTWNSLKKYLDGIVSTEAHLREPTIRHGKVAATQEQLQESVAGIVGMFDDMVEAADTLRSIMNTIGKNAESIFGDGYQRFVDQIDSLSKIKDNESYVSEAFNALTGEMLKYKPVRDVVSSKLKVDEGVLEAVSRNIPETKAVQESVAEAAKFTDEIATYAKSLYDTIKDAISNKAIRFSSKEEKEAVIGAIRSAAKTIKDNPDKTPEAARALLEAVSIINVSKEYKGLVQSLVEELGKSLAKLDATKVEPVVEIVGHEQASLGDGIVRGLFTLALDKVWTAASNKRTGAVSIPIGFMNSLLKNVQSILGGPSNVPLNNVDAWLDNVIEKTFAEYHRQHTALLEGASAWTDAFKPVTYGPADPTLLSKIDDTDKLAADIVERIGQIIPIGAVERVAVETADRIKEIGDGAGTLWFHSMASKELPTANGMKGLDEQLAEMFGRAVESTVIENLTGKLKGVENSQDIITAVTNRLHQEYLANATAAYANKVIDEIGKNYLDLIKNDSKVKSRAKALAELIVEQPSVMVEGLFRSSPETLMDAIESSQIRMSGVRAGLRSIAETIGTEAIVREKGGERGRSVSDLMELMGIKEKWKGYEYIFSNLPHEQRSSLAVQVIQDVDSEDIIKALEKLADRKDVQAAIESNPRFTIKHGTQEPDIADYVGFLKKELMDYIVGESVSLGYVPRGSVDWASNVVMSMMQDRLGIQDMEKMVSSIEYAGEKIGKALQRRISSAVMPEEVISSIKTMRGVADAPKEIEDMRTMWHWVTNLTKIGLLAHPARFVRDMTSSMLRNIEIGLFRWSSYKAAKELLSGGRLDETTRMALAANESFVKFANDAGYATNKPGWEDDALMALVASAYPQRSTGIAEFTGTAANRPERIEDLLRSIPGASPVNPISDVLQPIREGGVSGLFEFWKVKGSPFLGEGRKANSIISAMLRGRPTTDWSVAEAMSRANYYPDYYNRVSALITALEDGQDVQSAVRTIDEALVNYDKLYYTDFEKKFLLTTGLLPFGRFLLRQLQWTAKRLVTNPGSLTFLIREAALRASAKDPTTPEYAVSSTAIPLGERPEGSRAYLTGLSLMSDQSVEILDKLFNVAALSYDKGSPFSARPVSQLTRAFISQTHPLVRGISESALGKSAYFDRPLEELSPPIGSVLANVRYITTGEKVDPRMLPTFWETAIRYSPLSRFADSMRRITDPQRTITDKMLSEIFGMRVAIQSKESMEATYMKRLEDLMRSRGIRFSRYGPYLTDADRTDPEKLALYDTYRKLRNMIVKRRKSENKEPADDLLSKK